MFSRRLTAKEAAEIFRPEIKVFVINYYKEIVKKEAHNYIAVKCNGDKLVVNTSKLSLDASRKCQQEGSNSIIGHVYHSFTDFIRDYHNKLDTIISIRIKNHTRKIGELFARIRDDLINLEHVYIKGNAKKMPLIHFNTDTLYIIISGEKQQFECIKGRIRKLCYGSISVFSVYNKKNDYINLNNSDIVQCYPSKLKITFRNNGGYLMKALYLPQSVTHLNITYENSNQTTLFKGNGRENIASLPNLEHIKIKVLGQYKSTVPMSYFASILTIKSVNIVMEGMAELVDNDNNISKFKNLNILGSDKSAYVGESSIKFIYGDMFVYNGQSIPKTMICELEEDRYNKTKVGLCKNHMEKLCDMIFYHEYHLEPCICYEGAQKDDYITDTPMNLIYPVIIFKKTTKAARMHYHIVNKDGFICDLDGYKKNITNIWAMADSEYDGKVLTIASSSPIWDKTRTSIPILPDTTDDDIILSSYSLENVDEWPSKYKDDVTYATYNIQNVVEEMVGNMGLKQDNAYGIFGNLDSDDDD